MTVDVGHADVADQDLWPKTRQFRQRLLRGARCLDGSPRGLQKFAQEIDGVRLIVYNQNPRTTQSWQIRE